MSTLYQIRDWDLHFENNKSRERELCAWCPIPNKQDGLGYGRVMRARDGEAIYGAFMAVVLVASKQNRPRAGYLTDTGRADGVPYDSDALSIKTKARASILARMLALCSDESIGWIDTFDTSASGVPAKCPPGAIEVKRREEKEEKRREGKGEHFTPPTIEEARVYIQEKGYHFTAEEFIGKGEAVGWVTGKNRAPLKSWKGWMATWEANWRENHPERATSWQTLCTRCGKEPRRPDSEMGEKCFKELRLGLEGDGDE